MKFKELFFKYKKWIGLGALILIFFIVVFSLLDSKIRGEKSSKIEIKALHSHNIELTETLKEVRDSIDILHNEALKAKSKDTIFIKKLEYLKTKADEEISHYNTLDFDSQYAIFSTHAEEYIATGFNNVNN